MVFLYDVIQEQLETCTRYVRTGKSWEPSQWSELNFVVVFFVCVLFFSNVLNQGISNPVWSFLGFDINSLVNKKSCLLSKKY